MIRDNDAKFTGELLASESADLENAADHYEHALQIICDIAAVPMHRHNFIAFQMLGGRARQNAAELAKRAGVSIPPLASIKAMVRQMATGSAMGLVTRTERLFQFCLKGLALHTYKQQKSIPDIHYCINIIQKEIDKRPPIDAVTLAWFWVHVCRNLPDIERQIRICTVNGVQQEQTDPESVVQSLMALNYQFKPLIEAAVHGTQPRQTGSVPSLKPGPSTKAGPPSNEGWQQVGGKRKQPEPKKAKTTPTPANFNPFTSLPNGKLSHTPFKNAKPWIAGFEFKNRPAAGHCWLCKAAGHTIVHCPQSKAQFQQKKFCWYPPDAAK